MEINAIEKGAAEFSGVFDTLRGANALSFGITFESAWARVHGGNEDAFGGESMGGMYAGNGDLGIFERLAQSFENIATEFWDFVEE